MDVLELSDVCACQVAIDLGDVDPVLERVDLVVMSPDVETVAEQICSETLAQEDIVAFWSSYQGSTETFDGAVDLSPYDGMTLFVARKSGVEIVTYEFLRITSSSATTSLTVP